MSGSKSAAVLDQLRHEYDAKYNELMKQLERNRNLAAQLPQPSTATGGRPRSAFHHQRRKGGDDEGHHSQSGQDSTR